MNAYSPTAPFHRQNVFFFFNKYLEYLFICVCVDFSILDLYIYMCCKPVTFWFSSLLGDY